MLVLLICGVLLLTVQRKYAVLPLLALVCFISGRQCLAIAGVNFYFLRVLVLFFGAARVLMKGELRQFQFCALDRWILAYGAVYWLTGAVNWGFSLAEIKMRSGFLVEIVGLYFLLRVLIRTPEDASTTIRSMALLSIPLFLFFIIENRTGRNLFAIFGGVPEITMIREGRLRCQGAFGHPILAGTVWASFFPLVVCEVVRRGWSRLSSLLSMISIVGIVILSASSTPVLGVVVGGVLLSMYSLRKFTRGVIALLGVLIVVLHFSMTSPVWSLIGRINVTAGNSGYHRYLLVDGFINHWGEWWLLGSTVGASHWGHFTHDTANQYVAVGLQGGIVALFIFFAIIVSSLLSTERICRSDPWLGWCIGVSIVVHCVCFLGISIWGQMHFAWAFPLALAGSLQHAVATTQRRQEQVVAVRTAPVEAIS
ncbi:hypothetical protein C5Y93_22205 [Blastopirellula marina]|uniref:O-antigen ligase domain-containing protein n=1 Tax=Blastopirellula marina TaxID=124 RepID=A0A2S8GHW1_9BACT|nr:hypothetical protein C5Y93_22205 [Blastopirellula marina]